MIVSGNCRVRFRRGCQTGNFLSQCMAEIPSLKGLKYEKIIVIEFPGNEHIYTLFSKYPTSVQQYRRRYPYKLFYVYIQCLATVLSSKSQHFLKIKELEFLGIMGI